jgi:ATP-dependent Lon protease
LAQELAVTQLTDAVCDHVKNVRTQPATAAAREPEALAAVCAKPSPRKPLVLSLHGPPGVGKTYFHKLLAEAVYNMTGGGRPAACDTGARRHNMALPP